MTIRGGRIDVLVETRDRDGLREVVVGGGFQLDRCRIEVGVLVDADRRRGRESPGCGRRLGEFLVEEVEGVAACRRLLGDQHRRVGSSADRTRRFGVREQLVHAIHQRLGFEGLGDVAVGADAPRAVLVEPLEGARQQQHGNVSEFGIGS